MSYPSIRGCVNYRDPKSARDIAKVILIRLKQSSSLELAFEDELGLSLNQILIEWKKIINLTHSNG